MHNYPDFPNMVQQLYSEWLSVNQRSDSLFLPQSPASFIWLAQLLWLEPDELYTMTLHRFADIVVPLSQEIPIKHLRPETYTFMAQHSSRHFLPNNESHYCPECLQDAAYHRLYWSIRLGTICQKHRCLLLDHCPDCGQTVNVSSVCTASCAACGAALSLAKTVDLANDKLGIEAQETLYSWLNKVPDIHDENEIISLQARASYQLLHELYELLEERPMKSLGHRVSGLSFKKRDTEYSIWQIHLRLTTAFKILTNWPANFHRFITAYRFSDTQKKAGGLPAELGDLYRCLQKNWNAEAFEAVQEAFENYFVQDYSHSFHVRKSAYYRQRPYLSQRMEYLTYLEAASILQLQPKALTIIAEAGQLERIRSNDSAHFLFSRKQVELLNRHWTVELTLDEIAVKLDLDIVDVKHLAEVGFLVAKQPLDCDQPINWRFPSVFSLWLFSQARKYLPGDHALLSLQNTVSRFGSSIPVFHYLMTGELPGFLTSGYNSISNIQFPAKYVEECLSRHKRLNAI